MASCTLPSLRVRDVSVPLEVILGPLGAVGVLLLWIADLRKERDELKTQLRKLTDALEIGLRRAEPPK